MKDTEVFIMIEKVQETHLYLWLSVKKSYFIEQLDKIIKYANDVLPLINHVFSNYTIHGMKHSINVMEYMYALITDIDKLSELEVALLIYSALLHDIGMVVQEDEIKEIKADRAILGERKYSKVLEKYGDEEVALQECIRPVHGKRSQRFIQTQMDENLFLIPNSTVLSFRDELGLICRSHNEDFEWIEKVLVSEKKKGSFDLNPQYIAVLLRLADYLDIDEQRAPFYLYKYLEPKEYSNLEWKQHFIIENYDKVLMNEKIGLKEIVFQGISKEPSVHRKLLKYFDSINIELKNAIELCEGFPDKRYVLLLKANVVNKIQTKGFSFSDMRLSLDYKAVTNLLMGEHIYGNKKYGLRELIQNSIDACKTMKESSLQMDEFRYQKYQPFISIILDKDRGKVMVMDNGSGMSLSILKKYFLNVGVSYYASDDYLLQGRSYSPIGHYGIGFLACFMLSDTVEVKTVYYEDRKMNRISFEKNSEYICLTYEEEGRQQGTEIILDYDQCLGVFDFKIEKLISFIEKNFLDSGIPIKISTIEDGQPNDVKCVVKDIKNVIAGNICLDSYLNGVEAYIECNYKQINFASKLSDLNGCDSYLYNDEDYTLVKENGITIKDYVEDGKIRLLNVPIITENDEHDFLKAYEVLENYGEALNKLGNYESVNIWGRDDEIGFYASDEYCVEESSESIVGGYTLGGYREQFGHASQTPLMIAVEEKNVIFGKSDMVLPYNESCIFSGQYPWEHTDLCYMKNVFLSELKLKIPYLVDGIVLKSAVVNILNSELVPNVSRNNVKVMQQEIISYAIGKAIHMWIYDNAPLTLEQKELLNTFILTKYGETNCCLK